MSERSLKSNLARLQEAEYSRGAAITREDSPAAHFWEDEAEKYKAQILEQATQRQGGEAVAWVDVPEGEQKSPHYPGYSFHGIQFLPAGRHSLHVVSQPAVPEGWKLVPVEPTEEMLYPAGLENVEDGNEAWKAMLAAAPEPPEDAT